MANVYVQVQKNVVNFCTYLEQHVEKWKKALQDSGSAIRGFNNQTEQLRGVEGADLDVEDFQKMKDSLKCCVYNGIEEEMFVLRNTIDKLQITNETLKSKLFKLEESTWELNWDAPHVLFTGNATQPPLSKILVLGLEFWRFFERRFEAITDALKSLDYHCEKSVASFVSAFEIDFDVKTVRELIALTQYVNNEKAIS
ncbi:hypothetical protein FQA39_LY01731 [Lamprigera yunnana]|nr:hypothetical protein FQA39_LY01731 [Lamprigera yunnana]